MSKSGKSISKSQSGRVRRRGSWVALASLALSVLALSVVGCSNSDTVSSNADLLKTDLGALNYFPVEVGYSASYVVTDANGVELRRESYSADSSVFINGHVGVTWVQRNLADSSVLSRGVMHWNSDRSVLFHSEDSSLSSERLLRDPLNETSQWPRWHAPNVTTNGDILIGVDAGQANDSNILGNGGSNENPNGANIEIDKNNPSVVGDNSNPQLSSFPTQGASTFYVASISDELVVNGKTYSDCIQIVNANSDQTVNRYWYHLGIGLVQYALNSAPDEIVGTENGALIN